MRRAGDLLASQYPEQVCTFRLPRFSDDGALRDLAQELESLAQWLDAPLGDLESKRRRRLSRRPWWEGQNAAARLKTGGGGSNCPPRLGPGGVFVVGGPMSDDSLLRLVQRLGSSVSGVESCTAPARWASTRWGARWWRRARSRR